MSARSLESSPQGIWLPEPAVAGAAPDTVLLGWLRETGLLTRRLRRLCEHDFRLDVLQEAEDQAAAAIRREVLLCCADRPCVYASTEVPAATLAAHPWLGALGGDSLGEALQNRADVSRSAFEFALLDLNDMPAVVAACQSEPAWARRSAFSIGTAQLTVTEVFLHGLLDCERQSVRAAG